MAEQGANLTLRIDRADPNPWVEDLTHSDVFFAFSRVLMPAIDICVGLVVLRALGLHASAWVRNHGKARKGIMDSMRVFLVIASVMQFAGCVVRAVYCIVGPFLCNARLLVDESMMLLNLSLPLQVPSIFVVSAMMRRITSLKRRVGPPSKRKVAFLVLVALGVWALELYAGYIRGRDSDEVAVLFSFLCTVLVCLCALIVFVVTGVPFLLQMRQSKTVQQNAKIAHASTVRTIRVRIARSVVLGSIGLLLQTASIAMFPVLLSAKGFAAIFTLYYLGFAITTLFHSLAFAPLFRVSVKQRKPSAPQIFLLNFGHKTGKKPKPNTDSVVTQVGFAGPDDLQAQPAERDIPKDPNGRNEEDEGRDAGQGPEDEEGPDVEQGQQGGIEQGKAGERAEGAESPAQQVELGDQPQSDADDNEQGRHHQEKPADQPPLRPSPPPPPPPGDDNNDEWEWDDFEDDVLVNDPSKRRQSSNPMRMLVVSMKHTPALLRRKLNGAVTGSMGRREAQQPRANQPPQASQPQRRGVRDSRGKQFFSRFHSAQ